MFRLFRRAPSQYAVAIRDSMTQTPERWRKFSSAGLSFVTDGLLLIETDRCYISDPYISPNQRDRRCIREGIEAWIAWSVQKREVCDE